MFRVSVGLLSLLLLLAGNAHSTESGILASNLSGWKGFSLLCDMEALPASKGMDQSGYVCGMFYGEFSKAAKQHEMSFAYVQTDGQYTIEKLIETGYLPIRVDMQATGDQIIQVKLVSDITFEKPLSRMVRIYENPIVLKGNPFTYGKNLISFYQNAAHSIVRDIRRYGGATQP